MLDTSVIIAFYRGELSSDAKAAIASGESSISVLTYTELCRYIHLAGRAREWNEIKAAISTYHILPLTPEVGERAAKEAIRSGLALADAISYATAAEHGMTLYTRDADFRKLKNVVLV
ncbi:hypothetical protein AUJ14_00275 [Candidatus Micrarchaeota archaeon CG1_02_55_22]|nr:MAG: hypothetical protein AUJ14_00275 [Candidatus Micrarchaeota archaeon CG1_02_55_22]